LAICTATLDDANATVRGWAVSWLPEDAPATIDLVLGKLRDTDVEVCCTAIGKLSRLKDPRVLPALLAQTRVANEKVVDRAVAALAWLGDRGATDRLMEVIRTGATDSLRCTAGYALQRLADPKALEALLALEQQPDRRRYALRALAGYQDPRVGPILLNALDPKNDFFFWEAVDGLAVCKYGPATPALLAAMAGRTPIQRQHIMNTIVSIGDPAALQMFMDALKDPDPRMQEAGIRGLGTQKDPRAIETLLALLPDADQRRVSEVARALGRIGDPRVIEPLLPYLTQKRGGISNEVSDALVALTGRSYVFMGQGPNVVKPGSPAWVPPPFELGRKPLIGNTFTFGQVTDAVFTIINISDCAIVITGLSTLTDAGEEPVTLSGSVYGTITKQGETVVYNGMPQQASREMLHAGFLLPGQVVQVAVRYRPVGQHEQVRVQYLAAAQAYDGTPASLRPLEVFIPVPGEKNGIQRSFKAFDTQAWRAVSYGCERTYSTGPDAGKRAVYLANPPTPLAPREFTARLGGGVLNTGFFIENATPVAARIAGAEPGTLALAYSAALCGYVVLEKETRWLLKNAEQTTRGDLLPHIPLRLLHDADAGDVQVRVGDKQVGLGPDIRSAGRKLWDTYPVVYGDGMYTRGEFITLTPAQLPTFLATLREKGGSLTRHTYYFQSGYYELKLAQ
jgi:HEAT repeat protein